MLPDSVEVLTALAHVDTELSQVEAWLGAQIGELSHIQSKLGLIESESGFLETSYHNLSSMHSLIDTVLRSLSLDKGKRRS